MTLTEKFIAKIPTLDPVQFSGLAIVLGVKLYNENKEPKDFCEVLDEVLNAYTNLNRDKKREILNLVRKGGS